MPSDLLNVILARFGGYILTGGTAAVVDTAGFAVLHALGLQVMLAAILSFLAAAVVNYVLTSRYVFRERLGLARWFAFIAFACVGLVVNVSATTVIAGRLDVIPELAKVAGIGVAFLLNFALNYAVVFRAKPAR